MVQKGRYIDTGAYKRYLAEQEYQKQLNNIRNAPQNANANKSGLGAFLGGLAERVGDVGKAIYGTIGGGVASFKDLIESGGANQKNLQAFTKSVYGTDDYKDAVAKQLGTSINAADTLTDLIPGVGIAKSGLVGGATSGAIGGLANTLKYEGKDFNLEDAGKAALAGAAGGALAGKVAGNIGNATSTGGKLLLNNKLATSAVGRGAIAGAAGGAAGAGANNLLSGGDLGSALGAAAQGGMQGALQGGAMAGLTNAATKAGQKARGKAWGMDADTATAISRNARSDSGLAGALNRWEDKQLATRAENQLAKEVKQKVNDQIDSGNLRNESAEDMVAYPAKTRKEAQFELLQETNPMRDDYHTGIRSADEINYLDDLVKNYDADTSEMFAYPDFTLDDANKAISKGEIEVFSSKPIEPGTFVTPSKMMAQDYAGGRDAKVYSKVMPIEDYAAMAHGDEGNYLPIKTKNTTTPAVDNFKAYGESELANKTSGDRFKDKVNDVAKKMMSTQNNATRTELDKLGIKDPGKSAQNVYKKTGLTDLQEQADFARELTGGANSLMDNVQRQALSAREDGGVFKAMPEVDIEKIVNKNMSLSSPAKRQEVINKLAMFNGDTSNDLITKGNIADAQSAAFRRKERINPTGDDLGEAAVYHEIASAYKDASYNAIPKENVDMMYDVTLSEMRARAKDAARKGNTRIEKAYTQAANRLAETHRSIKNFRSFKKDFVDIAHISDLTNAAGNAGSKMGIDGSDVIAYTIAGPKAAAAKLGSKALGPAVDKGIAWLGGKMTDFASNTTPTTTPTAATQSAPGIGSIGQVTLPAAIGRTQAADTASTAINDANYQAQQNAANEAEQALTASYQQNMAQLAEQQRQAELEANPIYQNMLQARKSMELALAAGDITAYNKLANIYSGLEDMAAMQGLNIGGSAKSTQPELTVAQQNQMAKLSSAGSALDELETLYGRAGGGQGIIGGNIANFLGSLGLNSDVATYNDLAQGLINTINAAVGKTDSLNTEGEVQRALSLVPKITDDATTAQNKISELRRLLGVTTSNYQSAYGMNA